MKRSQTIFKYHIPLTHATLKKIIERLALENINKGI